MPTYPFFWIGCYLAIGVLVHLFLPKTPKAKEAFEMAEKTHPAGWLLVLALVAVFWPFVILGTLRRLLFSK